MYRLKAKVRGLFIMNRLTFIALATTLLLSFVKNTRYHATIRS